MKLGSCPLRGVSCLACTGRNLWDAVGGNALFMNGYVRWCNLSRNEVRYPGDSAFAAVGRTAKFDATGGDYPQVIPPIGAEGLNRRTPAGSCRLFLGPGFRLAARWNRLVEAVKTRKKRGKTGKRWARYGVKGVKEGS